MNNIKRQEKKDIQNLNIKLHKEDIFNIAFLLLFFILTFSIFYIKNNKFLLFVLIYICFLFILEKVNFIKIIKFNIYSFVSFTLFITIINLFLMDVYECINITIKLILICNLSFILSIILPSYKLTKTINYILMPLNLLKINTENINLIISIGITFIPIIINEFEKIRISLVSKGIKYNSFQNIIYTIKVLLPNLFKKINEIDYSLISKGFNE